MPYLAKEMFIASDGFNQLSFLVLHLVDLQACCPDLLPALAQVIIRISNIDLANPKPEEEFHEHLTATNSLEQTAYVYNSPLYKGFMGHRYTVHLAQAKKKPHGPEAEGPGPSRGDCRQ